MPLRSNAFPTNRCAKAASLGVSFWVCLEAAGHRHGEIFSVSHRPYHRKNDRLPPCFYRQKQRKPASFLPFSNCSTWNNLPFHDPTRQNHAFPPSKSHPPKPQPPHLHPQNPSSRSVHDFGKGIDKSSGKANEGGEDKRR